MEKDKVGFPLLKCSNEWMLKGRFCSRRKFYGLIIRQICLPRNSSHIKFGVGTPKVLKEMVVHKFTVDGKTAEVVSEHAAADAMELD